MALNANLMPKQNTALLLSRYIWLIDTIYSAGSISREEIDRRWCRSLLSECYDDTCEERESPEVWADAVKKVHEYFPYIEDGEVPFVAHNKAFDENYL